MSRIISHRSLIAVALALATIVGVVIAGERRADAAAGDPDLADTARLLGYMWGDGSKTNGVWDVNGPSGTSSLIEHLVELHGGEWVNRQRLEFRLPAPYNFTHWTNGLPDDDARTRDAVQNPHFLAALMETEAAVTGQIYDQSSCCTPGYLQGRLVELRDLLHERGYSTARLVQFGNVDSGRVELSSSDWSSLRAGHRFVCPLEDSNIRIPGGTDYGRYGNLRWFDSDTRWSNQVRTDCEPGRSIPAVPAPAGTCSVRADGTRVTVDWTFTLGDVVVRRNNSYITTQRAADGTWTESRASGTHTYDVRVYALGERTDRSCGFVTIGGGGGEGPCTVSAVANGVRLDWDDFGKSSYSVRRNGKWVASATGTSFTTTVGSVNDSWTVRYRSNGSNVDVACTTGGGGGNAPCSVSLVNGQVRLTWTSVAGVDDYQVRRNGSWYAATSATTWTGNGSINDDWSIRYRANKQTNNLACT